MDILLLFHFSFAPASFPFHFRSHIIVLKMKQKCLLIKTHLPRHTHTHSVKEFWLEHCCMYEITLQKFFSRNRSTNTGISLSQVCLCVQCVLAKLIVEYRFSNLTHLSIPKTHDCKCLLYYIATYECLLQHCYMYSRVPLPFR